MNPHETRWEIMKVMLEGFTLLKKRTIARALKDQ